MGAMSTASRRGAAPSPPAPTPPKGRQSAYQIEKGLKESLESVDKGLKQFLNSLQESRMTEALQGYRMMQRVLIQQRLWAHTNSRSALVPLFRSIAHTAGELHRIFSGYTEAMRPLKELDKITRLNVGSAAEQPPVSGANPPPGNEGEPNG
jgi:hypothetical protein